MTSEVIWPWSLQGANQTKKLNVESVFVDAGEGFFPIEILKINFKKVFDLKRSNKVGIMLLEDLRSN